MFALEARLELSDGKHGRPPAMRVGDHLALDFLNTVAAPQGAPIEWVASGRDLADWLVGAGALNAIDAARLVDLNSSAALDQVAAEARDLREWFRVVVARVKKDRKKVLENADLSRVNQILAAFPTYARLSPSNSKLDIVVERRWSEPRELLAPIAEAMADLLSDGDFALVKECENPPCTLWFYDRTKGHRRRWCSPAVCGNRAKVAAFRARKKQG